MSVRYRRSPILGICIIEMKSLCRAVEMKSFYKRSNVNMMPPKKQTQNPLWLKVVKETMKKYPSLPFSGVLKTAKAWYWYRKT